jgi:hypothetical protein
VLDNLARLLDEEGRHDEAGHCRAQLAAARTHSRPVRRTARPAFEQQDDAHTA